MPVPLPISFSVCVPFLLEPRPAPTKFRRCFRCCVCIGSGRRYLLEHIVHLLIDIGSPEAAAPIRLYKGMESAVVLQRPDSTDPQSNDGLGERYRARP